MKRHDFLDQLWKCLGNMPSGEKTKLMEYYNELYFDRLDSGEYEEMIVAGFGTPLSAAQKYLSEMAGDTAGDSLNAELEGDFKDASPPDKNSGLPNSENGNLSNEISGILPIGKEGFKREENSACENKVLAASQPACNNDTAALHDCKNVALAKPACNNENSAKPDKKCLLKNKTFWTIYFSAFIITFPLTGAAFGVAVGLVAAALGVLVALVAGCLGICIGMAGCTAAGIYGVVASFAVMKSNVAVGIVQLGVSLAAIAIGLVGIHLSIKLTKLVIQLFKRRKGNAKN